MRARERGRNAVLASSIGSLSSLAHSLSKPLTCHPPAKLGFILKARRTKPGRFNDMALVLRHFRVNEFPAVRSKAHHRSCLVFAHQAAIAGHISDEDGRKSTLEPHFGHPNTPCEVRRECRTDIGRTRPLLLVLLFGLERAVTQAPSKRPVLAVIRGRPQYPRGGIPRASAGGGGARPVVRAAALARGAGQGGPGGTQPVQGALAPMAGDQTIGWARRHGLGSRAELR